MSFPGKKKWNKKERGEKKKIYSQRVSFHLRRNLHPPSRLSVLPVENLERYRTLPLSKTMIRKKKKRKGNRDRVSFRRLEDRCTHEEKFTFVEVWTVTESSLWLQARGREGEFRPPSGFRQGRKLDRRQVAGQSITEAGSVTGFDVKSMQILISM